MNDHYLMSSCQVIMSCHHVMSSSNGIMSCHHAMWSCHVIIVTKCLTEIHTQKVNQCHVDQYHLTRQQFHHDNFLSFSHKLHRDILLVQGVHKNGSYSPSHKLVKDTFWLWKEPKKCNCCLSTPRKWGNFNIFKLFST